jgi:hypothetical protein
MDRPPPSPSLKERERGTLEQLMVTPVSPLAVVVGKIIPYLVLAYVELVIVLTLMMLLSSVYLFALLSFGLLISSRAKSQMEAMQPWGSCCRRCSSPGTSPDRIAAPGAPEDRVLGVAIIEDG